MTKFTDPNVASLFASYSQPSQQKLRSIRDAIFRVANETPVVGQIEETLKWGQPAYLTWQSKSGTTIRISTLRSGGFGIFAHCQTTVISDFKLLFPKEFRYDGNRGVIFNETDELNFDHLDILIHGALTYHNK